MRGTRDGHDNGCIVERRRSGSISEAYDIQRTEGRCGRDYMSVQLGGRIYQLEFD
jgi:hypothetical protein